MVRNDQRGLDALAKATTTAEDGVKIQEALRAYPEVPRPANACPCRKVQSQDRRSAKKLASELEKIGFDKVFPKLAEMKSANLINGGNQSLQSCRHGHPMCRRSWFAAPSPHSSLQAERARTVDSCGI